jgi:hypothetical protein
VQTLGVCRQDNRLVELTVLVGIARKEWGYILVDVLAKVVLVDEGVDIVNAEENGNLGIESRIVDNQVYVLSRREVESIRVRNRVFSLICGEKIIGILA